MSHDGEMISSPAAPEPNVAEAWLKVSAKLGSLATAITEDRMARTRERERPLRAPRVQAGTVANPTAPLTLDLGGPAMGRRWVLRLLGVSDAASVATTLTGTADVYVGVPGVTSPAHWRWHFATLPNIEKFSDDHVEITPGQRLYVVVTGATASQIVQAIAEVDDFPLGLGEAVIPL